MKLTNLVKLMNLVKLAIVEMIVALVSMVVLLQLWSRTPNVENQKYQCLPAVFRIRENVKMKNQIDSNRIT